MSGWTVRASLARDGSATIRCRSHGLTVGQPLDFGATAPGTSALELLLAALASDLVLRFHDLCERRRLPLDQLEARVQGLLGNELVALGVVGETGDPALAEANVTLSVASPADPGALRGVWDDVLARSPVLATLRKGAALTLDLQLL